MNVESMGKEECLFGGEVWCYVGGIDFCRGFVGEHEGKDICFFCGFCDGHDGKSVLFCSVVGFAGSITDNDLLAGIAKVECLASSLGTVAEDGDCLSM